MRKPANSIEPREAPHTHAALGAKPKRRWRGRIIRSLLFALVVIVIVIGPWPSFHGRSVGSSLQQRAWESVTKLAITPVQPSPLRIGVASIDITPGAGHEIAGYSRQADKRSKGVDEPVLAAALSIEASGSLVTILTADLLLIHPTIAERVLRRTHLAAEEVFFTASHTHSGPGQFAPNWYERFSIGTYDAAYAEKLADALSNVIMQSRESLVPAEMACAVAHAPERIRSRIDGMNETDDRLVALAFRSLEDSTDAARSPSVILVMYAAHATTAGRDDVRISPDYPGGLRTRLRALMGAEDVLFAAGAVGDAAPYPPQRESSFASAREMGVALADALAPSLSSMTYQSQVELQSVRVPVELPAFRVPIGARWQTSPILLRWFDEPATSMHMLRVGPVLLSGMPGDFAGGAARPFISWATARGCIGVTTSFNGEYQGYFVSSAEFFGCPKMEQLFTFVRGPWAGEHLADIAVRTGERMLDPPPDR